MNRQAALHSFFNSLGLRAYPSDSVPQGAEMPYLTYTLSVSDSMGETAIELNAWFCTASAAVPNTFCDSVAKAVGMGGEVIAHDGGATWIKRGSPLWYSVEDDDPAIKRRTINLTAENIGDF